MEIVQFKSLNHVPPRFRSINGVRLTLAQVNEIVMAAQKNSAGPNDFARALGQAKADFREKHTPTMSGWV